MSRCACHHCHSEYSLLDSVSTIDDIINRTKELGYPSVTVTDHGNVSSALELSKKCLAADIKPIFAIEAYHGLKTSFKGNERDQAHLIIGAMNDEGLKNLFRLSDKAASYFRFVPRTNWEALESFKEGLWATSACIQGLVSQDIRNGTSGALDQYLRIFGDNFYIELHTYPTEEQKLVNLALVQLAKEKGLPVIWASDAHYSFKEQAALHDIYLMMQMGDNVNVAKEDRKMWHPPVLYIQSEDEIRVNLAYLGHQIVDEAIENSYLLSEKCNASLPEIRRHLPVFVPSESKFVQRDRRKLDAADLLTELAVEGLYERYENPSEDIWKRLRMELDIFVKAKLESYFLQAWEICAFCEKEGILRGPGRGSAPGSLLAYCLRITDIDPIYYNLYFERFYNAGREKGLPDIDIDFPIKYRDKIKEFAGKRWGEAYVENIGTHMRMKPIVALRRTAKVFLIESREENDIINIVKKVPDINILGSDSIGWFDDGEGKVIYVWDHVGDKISEYVANLSTHRQPIVQRWLDFVAKVVGRINGYGIHASGVVISDIPISDELPRAWSASSAAYYTQFPMKDVANRQFMKDDFLGIRNLDTLDDWKEQMKLQGVEIEWSGLEKQEHPEEMWQMLDYGFGLGIFQVEDGNFPLGLCKEIKPRSVEDMAVIVALNRPGPIRAGTPAKYIKRRKGEESVIYDHPFLNDILHDTYGEWTYQEQVIAFFSKLGYSLEEADAVRSILGKKKPEDMRNLLEGKKEWKGRSYREVAKPVLGDKADLIWNKIEDFSRYSFNRSHALCYGAIGFRTLFAKYWGTTEFILACIRTNSDDQSKYIAEGRRLGVEVCPPNIINSDQQISIKNKVIYMGISEIKGWSKSSSKYFLELRDKYQFTTKEEVIKALDIENDIWFKADKAKRFKVSPKTRIKSNQINLLEEIGAFGDDISVKDRRVAEKKLLGIAVTQMDTPNPFEAKPQLLYGLNDYDQIEDLAEFELPAMIGLISEIVDRNGNDMALVTIEYGLRNCSFAVFSDKWKKFKFLFKEGTYAIISLKRNNRGIFLQNIRRAR